jgi:hypothetical protein
LDDSPKIKTGPGPTHENKQKLLHFFVWSVLAARIAKFLGLHAIGVLLLVFCRCVVAIFAIATLQRDDFPHELILFS